LKAETRTLMLPSVARDCQAYSTLVSRPLAFTLTALFFHGKLSGDRPFAVVALRPLRHGRCATQRGWRGVTVVATGAGVATLPARGVAKAVITFLPEVCFAVADAVGSVTLGALVIVFVGMDGGVGVSRVVVGIGATAVVVLAGEEIVVAVSVALCMVVAVGGAVTVLVGIAGSGVDVRVGIAVAVFVAVGGIGVFVGVLLAVGGIAGAVLVVVGTTGVAVAARGLLVAIGGGMVRLVGVIVGVALRMIAVDVGGVGVNVRVGAD